MTRASSLSNEGGSIWGGGSICLSDALSRRTTKGVRQEVTGSAKSLLRVKTPTEIGLAAGLLVFVGVTAAAGRSGGVVSSKVLGRARVKYHEHQSRTQKSFHLSRDWRGIVRGGREVEVRELAEDE